MLARARTRLGVHSASLRGRLLGPGHAVAELLHTLALSSSATFWLLSFGLYVPAPARLAPPSSGPACREIPSGAPASLISSGAPASLISSGNFPTLAQG
ncbi:hypothetical protein FQP90_13395 [Paenarthrobacter nitroguajacolicus]|uniref:Uncharacterized protein n=1 Tax=Paenarthrobacter nitroguajacolicus TaxID=211146 RepID=A0A558GYS6_PAENT|nr:hypothetical protein [Paenarthrobacter nitroguajacolicus]TVU62044.1 hypothetical protein FQP90_13395 [Paenarthrobacter nitroguajacolicus]